MFPLPGILNVNILPHVLQSFFFKEIKHYKLSEWWSPYQSGFSYRKQPTRVIFSRRDFTQGGGHSQDCWRSEEQALGQASRNDPRAAPHDRTPKKLLPPSP